MANGEEEVSRLWKWSEGAKRVHVNEPSKLGMAMNMNSLPGQICRWFGEILKAESGLRVGFFSWASM